MADYFDSEANWQYLVAEVESWKGTPFWEAIGAASRKGVAADCVSFVELAFANIGAITPIKWPERYVTFGGGKEMLEKFLTVMDEINGLDIVWTAAQSNRPAIKRGDLILCSSGLALHHLAIYMGDNIVIHCLNNGRGVQEGNIHDPVIAKNILRVYRVRHDATTDTLPRK